MFVLSMPSTGLDPQPHALSIFAEGMNGRNWVPPIVLSQHLGQVQSWSDVDQCAFLLDSGVGIECVAGRLVTQDDTISAVPE